MINSKFLRRLFIPSASTFVVHAKGKESKEDKLPAECEKLIKALDLPLYNENHRKSVEHKPTLTDDNIIVKTIRCMRQELKVFSDQFSIVKQQVAEVFLVGKAHTDQTVAYLREPDNTYPRIGAVTAGALTGYLFALRKGRFKKLLYMGAGAGAISSVLYPDEAKEYGEEGLKHMKKYVIIGYHFLNGVSRDLTGYELPNLPINNHHLSITDGHHHKESGDSVPEPSHLLPPTAAATHLHLHPDEVKK